MFSYKLDMKVFEITFRKCISILKAKAIFAKKKKKTHLNVVLASGYSLFMM